MDKKEDTFNRLLDVNYKAYSDEERSVYLKLLQGVQKKMQDEIVNREASRKPKDFVLFDLPKLRRLFSSFFKRIVEVQGYFYLKYLERARK